MKFFSSLRTKFSKATLPTARLKQRKWLTTSIIGHRTGRRDETAIEEMELENSRLRQQVELLETVLDDNHALRIRIDKLESSLSREPDYADVLRELVHTKMALALLQLEREQWLEKHRKCIACNFESS